MNIGRLSAKVAKTRFDKTHCVNQSAVFELLLGSPAVWRQLFLNCGLCNSSVFIPASIS